MLYASNTNTRDERSLMSRANESYIWRLPPEFICCRDRFTRQTAVGESSSLDAGNLEANELSERIDRYLLSYVLFWSLLSYSFRFFDRSLIERNGIEFCYFQRLIVRDMPIRIIIDNSNSFPVNIIIQLSVQCIYNVYNRQHQASSKVDIDFHDIKFRIQNV